MPRKRELGPLDRRKKIVRCEACSTRKTKCVGGIPCESCIRTGKTCQKRASEHSETVFVFYKETNDPLIPAQMAVHTETIYLNYFFAFLSRNELVHHKNMLVEAVMPLVSESALMSSAARAIGALDASRHGFCGHYRRDELPQSLAYKTYSFSIESLKIALVDLKVSQRDDVLWATFFLGLFELMADTSGDGWAKHMLYGTSRLLQVSHPQQAISRSRKAFLDIFRIFEANRAIIYGERTILSSLDWNKIYQIDDHKPIEKGDILSPLMVRISTFNIRFYAYIRTVTTFDMPNPILGQFGIEAAEIQCEIFKLHREITNRGFGKSQKVSQTHLGLACCHAMLIFLFNTFDYYRCWHLDHSPYLSASEISHHVEQILQQAEFLLDTPGGSGVLLVFPLRVAGTRAESRFQKARVLDLLDRIIKQGFIVATRIKVDLHEYWDWKARSDSLPEMIE
ncbi:hypothetical protein F1880_006495 [Penicillium rolfsii]|nr:hypothetical protein F1880_006495 [Penicillium rolfsii]